MNPYERQAYIELQFWKFRMQKRPSVSNRLTKQLQDKVNSIIPEKVHQAITTAIEKMIKGVLYGSSFIPPTLPSHSPSLQSVESAVKNKIESYKKTASAEGAITGAGGLLMGLADFPLLLAIKIKLLFDIAALYGYDVNNYKERLYILYIFQIAFSSQAGRNKVYAILYDWDNYAADLPADADVFDWRTFQQEYRDYIDVAKIAQLLPIIGAAVGAIVNYRLINHLGATAINSYRMRRNWQEK